MLLRVEQPVRCDYSQRPSDCCSPVIQLTFCALARPPVLRPHCSPTEPIWVPCRRAGTHRVPPPRIHRREELEPTGSHQVRSERVQGGGFERDFGPENVHASGFSYSHLRPPFERATRAGKRKNHLFMNGKAAHTLHVLLAKPVQELFYLPCTFTAVLCRSQTAANRVSCSCPNVLAAD